MMSLRARLLVSAALFLTAALLVAAFLLTLLFERHVTYWIDRQLESHLEQLITSIDRTPEGAIAVTGKPADSRFQTPQSGLYWQVVFDDGTVQRSRSLWDFVLELPEDPGIDSQIHQHSAQGPGGQTLYLIQKTVELPQRLGRPKGRFAVALDKAEVDAAVWRFAGALAPFLLLLGLLLVAASWLQVGLGLKPLASIRSRVEQIRTGHEKRLGGDFPTEVRPLVQEIDTLLEAREKQLQSAKARAGDLAHGLKTPLQVIVGGIAKLKAQGQAAIACDLEDAAQMMQRHVDRQLVRSRMMTDTAAARANVRESALDVVRVLQRATHARSLQWKVEVPAQIWARIHPDDLSEALGSLGENAARHAVSRVEVTAHCEDGAVVITVYDDGPGIPEAQLADALRRGRRLDTSGDGYGLGLAIVADIAEGLSGSVGATRERDGMFGVTLRLPLVAAMASSRPARATG